MVKEEIIDNIIRTHVPLHIKGEYNITIYASRINDLFFLNINSLSLKELKTDKWKRRKPVDNLISILDDKYKPIQ